MFKLQTVLCCFSLILIQIVTTNQVETLSDIITLHHGGQIQGRQLTSFKNKIYQAFQEIPYATPPTGVLRFKETTEAKGWRGILKTSENTKVCIQLLKNDLRENEDCLYLNVYTPVIFKENSTLLPVYIYIHGGFLLNNAGTFDLYGPRFLMDYGIILVTMNYRLGAFGFLSTEDSVIPGNFGFKDQNLALKWVQKNIHNFGGDPRKVTLGGQSAGASCTGHHLLSERSRGLFRAAILQSGSPICSKMFAKHPRYFAFELGHLLDKSIAHKNSSQELLKVLQGATANDIKKHSDLPIPENLRNCVGNVGNTVWNPVEEFGLNAFVKGPMHENLKIGKFYKVPILIGATSEEEMLYDLDFLKSQAKYFDTNSTYLINGNLNIKEESKQMAGNHMKKIYTTETFEQDIGALIRFISDSKYTNGIFRLAELASQYTNVFLYIFSYDGYLGGNNKSVSGAEKVGHAEEINYLFENNFNRNIDQFPKKDLEIQRRLLTLWTNFIKYENPLPEILYCHSDYCGWPKLKGSHFRYININRSLEVNMNPRNYREIKKIYEEYADEFQYTF